FRPAVEVPPTGPPAVPTPVPPAGPAAAPGPAPATASSPAGAGSLAAVRGRVVLLDPGHNGQNFAHPSVVNALVNVLTQKKECDTTGSETAGGYTEAAYNLDLATRTAAILRAAGARAVLTRDDNGGVGPCITARAAIGNTAHAAVALSIHADGAAPGGRGFHVIEPVGVGYNDTIVGPSHELALSLRSAFAAGTGEPFASYLAGGSGLMARAHLGGLNLSLVPKVFLESGNMRNATDAARLSDPAYRQQEATAIATGLAAFLSTH
ncbi:MAG: N-acetylmuramoyl-L-alanine amidase, partial [Actinomycetota bacterium]|nr:N-acetylmuramoyl-L-alanine amidase [Actinomycetota bacterium]